MPDAHDQIANAAGRGDDRSFQEVADDLKPHFSEREVLLLELVEYMFTKMHFNGREHTTELMRELANVPDKQRLALMEIQAKSSSLAGVDDLLIEIHNLATNALK